MSIERFQGGQSDENAEEPKLIIDEDWKTQVQREKELFKQKQSESRAASSSADKDSSDAPIQAAESEEPKFIDQQSAPELGRTTEQAESSSSTQQDAPPPASFEYLVSGMATQALAAMGQLPDEEGNPYPANLDYAKHYIDLLGVLEAKTKGNLTEFEQRFLQDALHQLRMLFVEVKKG